MNARLAQTAALEHQYGKKQNAHINPQKTSLQAQLSEIEREIQTQGNYLSELEQIQRLGRAGVSEQAIESAHKALFNLYEEQARLERLIDLHYHQTICA